MSILTHLLKAFKKCLYFWLHWVFVALFGAFSSCDERGHSVVVQRLLFAGASLTAEHRLQGEQASVAAAHGLRSCGSQALEHTGCRSCGLWALEHSLSECGTGV